MQSGDAVAGERSESSLERDITLSIISLFYSARDSLVRNKYIREQFSLDYNVTVPIILIVLDRKNK